MDTRSGTACGEAAEREGTKSVSQSPVKGQRVLGSQTPALLTPAPASTSVWASGTGLLPASLINLPCSPNAHAGLLV